MNTNTKLYDHPVQPSQHPIRSPERDQVSHVTDSSTDDHTTATVSSGL
jgi:hypothetical protein